MKARAALKQKESVPFGHCIACDLKGTWQPRNNEKCPSQAIKRKRNGFRIMLKERPLGQESKFKMQRERSGRSRNIQRQLNTWD